MFLKFFLNYSKLWDLSSSFVHFFTSFFSRIALKKSFIGKGNRIIWSCKPLDFFLPKIPAPLSRKKKFLLNRAGKFQPAPFLLSASRKNSLKKFLLAAAGKLMNLLEGSGNLDAAFSCRRTVILHAL